MISLTVVVITHRCYFS